MTDDDGLESGVVRRLLLLAFPLRGQIHGDGLLLLDERRCDHEDDQQREPQIDEVREVQLGNRRGGALAAEGAGHGTGSSEADR